jgi:hypothetical protein
MFRVFFATSLISLHLLTMSGDNADADALAPKVIGQGKDGLVVRPPVPCEGTRGLEVLNYVGKIYNKSNRVEAVKENIDRLPAEYDGVLYYKENRLCDIDLATLPQSVVNSMPTKSRLNKLSNKQLVLRYVEGATLDSILHQYAYLNDSCAYVNLLKAGLDVYHTIEKIVREHRVYFNDIGSSNCIYNPALNKIMAIDLDDITYDKPMAHKVYKDDAMEPEHVRRKFIYEGAVKYMKWEWVVIDSILMSILEGMALGFEPESDAYLAKMKETDAENKAKFERREQVLREVMGKELSRTTIAESDVSVLVSRFDEIRQRLCDDEPQVDGSGSGSVGVGGGRCHPRKKRSARRRTRTGTRKRSVGRASARMGCRHCRRNHPTRKRHRRP